MAGALSLPMAEIAVPAIHVLFAARPAWMPGTSPGMTAQRLAQLSRKTL